MRVSGSNSAFSIFGFFLFHYHIFLFYLIIYHYNYYFCIFTYDSPPLACGVRVWRLCSRVGQGPVVLEHEGVLLIWIMAGQGLTVFVVGADGGCLDIFSLAYHLSFLSPSLLDGWLTWNFTSISRRISFISRCWVGDGWLGVMETRLRLKKFPLQAGLESESSAARPAGQRLTI